ncbi:hypothetical protein HF086_012762 [Spodoptera exigua]|uniref:Uncharacterized protein n=1 Tax=Spodoptera exigua TaxID=7107 RepID=A0A922MW77_SPOEX|nr:hypothetical protein HF086_012762 [Spodoptera exigua]
MEAVCARGDAGCEVRALAGALHSLNLYCASISAALMCCCAPIHKHYRYTTTPYHHIPHYFTPPSTDCYNKISPWIKLNPLSVSIHSSLVNGVDVNVDGHLHMQSIIRNITTQAFKAMARTKCTRDSKPCAGSSLVLRRRRGAAAARRHGATGGGANGTLVVACSRRLPCGPMDATLSSSHSLPFHILDARCDLRRDHSVAALCQGSCHQSRRVVRSRRFTADDITDIYS